VTTFSCNGRRYRAPAQPTLAVCIDGTSRDYLEDALEHGVMPRLGETLGSGGVFLTGHAQVPTLTNVNNVSIVTGVSAAKHGIAGNHYLAPDGVERQLTDPSALRADTILAAARRAGIPALAVTAKDKLRPLLAAGGVPCASAERAHELTLDGLSPRSVAEVLGRPVPDIYDPMLSPYAIELALALAAELEATLVYCSLTDYVQHKVPPGEELARAFFAALDERLGDALDTGWRVGLAADHGMNAKTRPDGTPNVRYLTDVLSTEGIASARVVLPITDPYVAHHGALGSVAYVYVAAPARRAAFGALARLEGVEAVLDRSAAAAVFELPEDRIGDLMVLSDARTVLGKSEREHDLSAVAAGLRSHGGLHEREIPIVLCQDAAVDVNGRELRNADLFELLLGRGAVEPAVAATMGASEAAR
jgi:phosphonoacetate hydrolase